MASTDQRKRKASWSRLFRNSDSTLAWDKVIAGFASLAGVAGGIWSFYYKEVYTPASTPVNVSLDLKVQRQRQGSNSPWIPVLLTAGATNESHRILRINKTHWVAHARALPTEAREQLRFLKDVNSQMMLGKDTMSLGDDTTSLFESSNDRWTPIAFGPLFDNNEIRQKEKVSVQRMVYVPDCRRIKPSEDLNCKQNNPFRLLRVRVSIPTYAGEAGSKDLVRVYGGFLRGKTEYVTVLFCRAERTFREYKLRWLFDKFLLPRAEESATLEEPSIHYCPSPMSPRELDRVGAQVFTSTIEVNLDSSSTQSSEAQEL